MPIRPTLPSHLALTLLVACQGNIDLFGPVELPPPSQAPTGLSPIRATALIEAGIRATAARPGESDGADSGRFPDETVDAGFEIVDGSMVAPDALSSSPPPAPVDGMAPDAQATDDAPNRNATSARSSSAGPD
jgi:hypothetical protein